MNRDRRRLRICLVVGAIVLGWAVLAFGSALDFVTEGDVVITEDDVIFVDGETMPVRTIAVGLTGAGAVLCLILFPGRVRFSRGLWPLAVAAGFLLLYGWFMVGNAFSEHTRDVWIFELFEKRLLPWAPGTISRSESFKAMLELTAVMLALWAAIRASEGSSWRGLFALIALSGVVVALVGLFHKAAGAEAVYFMEDASQPELTIFAPFVYNANAGAYMNLCLALSMGLTLGRVGDENRRALGIFWALVSVVIIAAVIVAASKGAIITLGLTVALSLGFNLRRLGALFRSFLVQRGRKIERVALVVALGAVLASFAAIGINYAIKRWADLAARFDDPTRTDLTGRLEIMKLMTKMAGPEEGSWHGFGPGTLKHLVPYFTAAGDTPESLDGVWLYGHCDPLQTTVEWGWVGAAAWLVIGGGAVVCVVLLLRRRTLLKSDEVPLARGAAIGLFIVGLHSCQDFPLSIYSIHLIAMLICGVCWGLYAHRSGPNSSTSSPASTSARPGRSSSAPSSPG